VDVAVLPNIDKSGAVLIFNAIDMLGVEGAAEFAINGSLSSTLARARFAEILLRVRSIGGTASKSEIVAVREAHPGAIGTPGLAVR